MAFKDSSQTMERSPNKENFGDFVRPSRKDSYDKLQDQHNANELKKRPPSTPLTPSLITQNILKKNRFDEGDLTKKNLRNILMNSRKESSFDSHNESLERITQRVINVSDDEDMEEDLEQSKMTEENQPNISKQRQNSITHDVRIDQGTLRNTADTILFGSKEKRDYFESLNNIVDFELYKVEHEIESLLKTKKLLEKSQLIEFLELERMFERQK